MTFINKENSTLDSVIQGYKFEPIVNITPNSVFAYEMLSVLEKDVDSESFFSSTSSCLMWNIIQEQFKIINDNIIRPFVFINVPCSILMDDTKVSQMINNHPPNVIIELQNPERISLYDTTETNHLIHNVRRMQKNGLTVWLDDIRLHFFDDAMKMKHVISGVKIDKHEFWDAFAGKNVHTLIQQVLQISGSIIVEGIESDEHLRSLSQSAPCFGQGYWWGKEKFNRSALLVPGNQFFMP